VSKRISVAVATYNGEKYIKEQIDSILENLTTEDEIIVSDDGSQDGTLEILASMDCKGVEMQIIDGPGRGIKQNIANAIEHCEGKYIFLADQDDVWTKDKVDKILPLLKEGKHLVVHDARVVNSDLSKTVMPSFFEYRGCAPGFVHNMIKNRYMGCCMAFSSELKEMIIPIPDNIEMHDWWIGVLNDLKYKDSTFIKDQLLLYRRHDNNVSDFSHNNVFIMLRNRIVFLTELLKRKK